MDYEEKYKEALERARKCWGEYNDIVVAYENKGVCEEIFPELKESEDDKIRKKIIATIHLYYGEPLEDEAKEMIDWLEKQGEQKPTIYHKFRAGDVIRHIKQGFTCKIDSVDTEYRISECGAGTHLPFDAEDAYELVEQKPITHKYNVGATIYYNSFGETKSMVVANVVDIGDGNPMYEDADGGAVFEKAIVEQKFINHNDSSTISVELNDYCCKVFNALQKENGGVLSFARLQHLSLDILKWCDEQKKIEKNTSEWSDEDKDKNEAIVSIIRQKYDGTNIEEKKYYNTLINWLKSPRPQKQWKPSDEQMAQLGWIAKQNKDNMIGKELMSLYQDLKKLREE